MVACLPHIFTATIVVVPYCCDVVACCKYCEIAAIAGLLWHNLLLATMVIVAAASRYPVTHAICTHTHIHMHTDEC